MSTGERLDLAIHGNGFFKVTLADGTIAFTRDGGFNLDSTGQIVTSDGLPVTSFAGVTISPEATNVSISQTGIVSVTQNGTTSTAGSLVLSQFANSAGLENIGANLYRETPASGTEQTGTQQRWHGHSTTGTRAFQRQGR